MRFYKNCLFTTKKTLQIAKNFVMEHHKEKLLREFTHTKHTKNYPKNYKASILMDLKKSVNVFTAINKIRANVRQRNRNVPRHYQLVRETFK